MTPSNPISDKARAKRSFAGRNLPRTPAGYGIRRILPHLARITSGS